MAGSITDVFSQASSGTAPLASTLTAQKAIGASSLSVAASTGWATASSSTIWFKLYQATTVTTAQGQLLVPVSGTETLWKGLLSGLTVNNLTLTSGTDQLYPMGSIVEPMFTSSQMDAMYSGLIAEHNQTNGTHNAAAAATIANQFAAGAIPTAKLAADGGITNASLATGIQSSKLANPYKFSVYKTAAQSTSATAGTVTKVILDTKAYDTSTNFDATTNYRFTAPVAGFYQINAALHSTVAGTTLRMILQLYKNGSELKRGTDSTFANGAYFGGSLNDTVQMAANDYLEMYVFCSIASQGIDVGQAITYMSGFLVSAT